MKKWLIIVVVIIGLSILIGCPFGKDKDSGSSGIPTAPTNLTGGLVIYGSGSRILLEWKDNSSNENGFQIEVDGISGYALIGTIGCDMTRYYDYRRSGTRNYRVRAYNSAGYSIYSNVVRIDIN